MAHVTMSLLYVVEELLVRGVQEESLPSLISSITLYYMFDYVHCINFISNICYIFFFVILISLILCSIEITLVLNHLCMTTADENAI